MNQLIDHTLLKADATISMIKKLCEEAKTHHFKSVCIQPCFIEQAKVFLKESDVLVCTVIGFPLGANTIQTKVFEAENAIKLGADEIDMVANIGKIKEGNFEYVTQEIAAIKKAVGDKVLKVIIETCLLTDEEKIKACQCVVDAHADFVKTSTGFSTHGATIEDVRLLKDCVQDKAKVKAAGGVKTSLDLQKMVKAGAQRIGTSSGVNLVQNKNSDTSY